MTDDLPIAQFGEAQEKPYDWRNDPHGDDPDPDDEEIETPKDIIAMLGFDPALEEGGDEEPPAEDVTDEDPEPIREDSVFDDSRLDEALKKLVR